MIPDRRFQVQILPDLEWGVLVERFRNSERLGFDVATTTDQFVDWKNPSTPWFDLWTLLAGVAHATKTIRLGPCVAQIPLRDPATMARQVLTVDHISDGRVEVGLGLGLTVDPSYDMIGIANWENPERAARFDEYVQILSHMLANVETSYDGEYYSVKNATVHPSRQTPRPPIAVAAMGPQMMRYAATHGDTWNTMSFEADFEAQLSDTASRMARMSEICLSVGRDPDTLRHSYLMFDPDSRESGGRISYYDSTERFADMAGALLELGFSELGLYYPTVESQMPVFEEIALDMIPQLRNPSSDGGEKQ